VAKFAYYKRLGTRQRGIYDRSDAAGVIRIPGAGDLGLQVAGIARGLERDDRRDTEGAVQRLVDAVLSRLHVSPVTVRVLAVRPSNHREELHGLYEFGGGRKQPVISVWMRTAQRRRVVAFRTFMRTLLHEVVHHLDYRLLRLEDSYHTHGFYKRAEALYRQLVPPELAASAVAVSDTTAATAAGRPPKTEPPHADAPRRRRTPRPEPAGEPEPRARSPRRQKPRPEPQPLLPFML
jgi:hypothetical protein